MEIIIHKKNESITVKVPVENSLKASLLADRMNSLPYLKVMDRHYSLLGIATIKAYTIKPLFTYDQLQSDLEEMSNLYILKDDSLQNITER